MTVIQSLLLAAVVGAGPIAPGDYTRQLAVGELQRSYVVHMPPQYDAETPTPVVLVYHGGAGSPRSMMRLCGMNEKADEAGFIAVYPRGTGPLNWVLTFNGGNCCGYAAKNNVDDVRFTRQLLDDLGRWANIDTKRIFATGMSNGGIMAYLVASELSDRIAAIAPVGGPMGTETCKPTRPVSVIHFHGTEDRFAPFQGGRGNGVAGTDFLSVEHSIRAWVKANECDMEPEITELPDEVDDGTTVKRKTYGSGKDDAEVVLYVVKGGGHTWPGREPILPFLGKSTQDISANDLMWKFFQKHPMK